MTRHCREYGTIYVSSADVSVAQTGRIRMQKAPSDLPADLKGTTVLRKLGKLVYRHPVGFRIHRTDATPEVD
jgi:hypothetical protein